MLSGPKGIVPNDSYPPELINPPREEWASALISPTLESEHHNQPAIINGYLQLTGNARFSTYDISDPTAPVMLVEVTSPEYCADCGPKNEGEAEGHQVSFARYGNDLYTVTINGLGVDFWNITDAANPAHLKSVALEGVNFGDFTEAVWGVYWQGTTVYVGGTNTGLHIIDAADPANPTFVKTIPTPSFGNVSAGPLWAIGNILVITTPKESAGIATLDISDPHNPFVLDAISPTAKSYIGGFYNHHLYLQEPLRVWDVLSDPLNIGGAETPIGTLTPETSEYMSFADGYMFLGHQRPNPGATKIDVTDPTQMVAQSRIWGRMDLVGNDDQFTVAVGNLLVMSDDQKPIETDPVSATNSYAGTVIGLHAADPDTVPPTVDTIIPKDGATGQSVKSRIGLSLTDSVELATVTPQTFIVRPVGGEPIAGNWGIYATVLNFDPAEDLQPATTYEIVIPAGGLKDYVGNPIAAEFKTTFTTQ